MIHKTSLGAACAVLTCAVMALAGVIDLARVGGSHGAAWAACDATVTVIATIGAFSVVRLALTDVHRRQDLKAGFARPWRTPETKDLDV